MKSNPKGVDSLRSFTVLRRELDSSSAPRLIGRLSERTQLRTNNHCLIGLHGSWIWIEEFAETDDPNLFSLSTENSLIKDEDDVLYLLPPEFQPYISSILLDSQEIWRQEFFDSGFAASSKFVGTDGQNYIRTWPIKDESELEDGETLEVTGWDHEHCALCNTHIYRGHHYFVHEREDWRLYLCVFCHDRFALSHRIEEVIYPAEATRSSEEAS